MIKNMGTIDRVLRLVIAAVIGLALLTGQLTGWSAIVLGVLAVILAVTAAVGSCPLYLAFHISTRRYT